MQASYDWFWSHFWFVNRVAQEKEIADLLPTLSYKLLYLLNFVDLGKFIVPFNLLSHLKLVHLG